MKYSIIVPTYNSESTIVKTIDSILNGEYYEDNYEIIIVDDGSTDQTQCVLKKYEGNKRIKIKKTNNYGVSHARNTGLSMARGEYVMFIDSDDIVSSNYLYIINKLTELDYDLVQFDYMSFSNKITVPNYKNSFSFDIKKENIYDEIKKYIYAYKKEKSNISLTIWNKIYKKQIIKNAQIKFNEELHIYEDALFNLEYINECKSILINNDKLYYYRILDNYSLSHKFDENKSIQNEICKKALEEMYGKKYEINERIKYFTFESIVSYFKAFLFNKNCNLKSNEKKQKYEEVLKLANKEKIFEIVKIFRLNSLNQKIQYIYMKVMRKYGYNVMKFHYDLVFVIKKISRVK